MEIKKDFGIIDMESGYRVRFVLAKCFCGTEFKVRKNAINSGNTKSCGCLKNVRDENALCRLPEYNLFYNMKSRCYNKNRTFYKDYGGRGINICEKWLNDVWNFIYWCRNNGYAKGLQIDRIDNDKGYSPENCRFVSPSRNARNTRRIISSNTSGYRGVSRLKVNNGKDRWRARISINGEKKSLGVFKTRKDAAIAYDNYVIENQTGHTINNVLP